mgnify:CR=1 FL=1
MTDIPFGPTGELVYNRTYSRKKADGTSETWPETVRRVVDGNLSLVETRHQLPNEREELIRLMTKFAIIPAGRHLWASGVKGREHLFNCHVSAWNENLTDHFEFTFLRLMEGGGVGSNYSNRFLNYPALQGPYEVHVVCDPEHPDYAAMRDAGVLSDSCDVLSLNSHEVEDSREGWAAALVHLIDAYRHRAGDADLVFDVSTVRPKGSPLRSSGGYASGPLPLAQMLHEINSILKRKAGSTLTGLDAMEMDHAIAKCVVAGGNRRSARMAIMHWNDPQVEKFIRIKADTGEHWTTNISVEVDQDFWDLVLIERDERACRLLELIAEGMLTNGEPGFWNSTYANEGEPNEVVATNPCGEICLEPWENCNLGHINLDAFIDSDGTTDWEELRWAHTLMTRFLIRATYGDVNDPKQRAVLDRNRRIGVGHLGFASWLAKAGIRYMDAPESDLVRDMLQDMAAVVDEAARRFAHQLRIPVPVKTRTIAPTGTIAKLPGVSEGIHPVFARFFIRRVRLSTVNPREWDMATSYAAQGYHVEPCRYADNTMVVEIPTKDKLFAEVESMHGTARAEELVQTPADLSLEEMLRVQRLYQRYWADNAVSFTANVDPSGYTVQDVVRVLEAVGPDLKGATVFPEESLPQAPYERITREQYEASGVESIADSVDENCSSGACPVK